MSLTQQGGTGADVAFGPSGNGTSGGDGNGTGGGDGWPSPGDYKLKEKRSWKTWQLLVAMGLALLLGLFLNYKTVGSNQSSSAPGYTLPKEASSGATTTTSTSTSGSTTTTTAANGSTGAASGSTTTTLAGGTTTTSAPASSAAAGPARVLMGPTQSQGNWTSPSFTTTTAGWNIGWAFRCTPAPASGPSFQVFVTPAGGALFRKPLGCAKAGHGAPLT